MGTTKPLLLVLMTIGSSGCKSPLARAVEQGDQNKVLFLLGTSMNIGGVTRRASSPNERIYGKPLLTVAIENQNLAILQQLAQTEGADTSAADVWGMTPLHVAVSQCNTEAVVILLKYRANPNAKAPSHKWGDTNRIVTPLEGAVKCRNWPLFSALVLYGAKSDPASFSASLVGCNLDAFDPRYTIGLTRLRPEVIDELSSSAKSAVHGCKEALNRAMQSNIKIDLVDPQRSAK